MITGPVRADFEPQVGEAFRTVHEGVPVTLRLEDVRALGTALRPGGAFSLIFAGPSSPMLPQATYRIENGGLGAVDIFIVPIGRRPDGLIYEAIFT
jgi:hypothetical protein